MLKPENDRGFTITELLVVLVILGLIAAAISPQILGRLDSSKTRSARLQLDVVLSALDAFNIDVGRFPTEQEGLQALLTAPAEASGWAGPYIRSKRNITDPWGAVIRYKIGEQGQASITTFGADGKEGGSGVDGDLWAPDPT